MRTTPRSRAQAVAYCLMIALPQIAVAANFTPTRFDDPLPLSCTTQSCSLREAVIAANALPGYDVITLKDGAYVLSISDTGVPTEQTMDLNVTDALNIRGQGSANTQIISDFKFSGAETRLIHAANTELVIAELSLQRGTLYAGVPVFEGACLATSNTTLTLRGVVVSNCSGGSAVSFKNGRSALQQVEMIDNVGAGLRLQNHTSTGTQIQVMRNVAVSTCGGGVTALGSSAEQSSIRWDDSVISKNSAGLGGGVCVLGGSLTLSTPVNGVLLRIQDNSAIAYTSGQGFGGGMHVASSAFLQALRLRVNGNLSDQEGGGIDVAGVASYGGSLLLSDSEVAYNLSAGDGGGIRVRAGAGMARIERVSLAFNTSAGFGGGVSSHRSGLRLTNVSTHGNSASAGGGMNLAAYTQVTHVTSLGDIGGALRYGANVNLENSVLVGGCQNAGAGSLNLTGGVMQASGYAPCPSVPIFPESVMQLAYAPIGGTFDAVRFVSASSVLRNAGFGMPVIQDIAGKPRTAPVDVGAFEWQ